MAVTMSTPDPADLAGVLEAVAAWQLPGSPLQLHPGDIGWFGGRGEAATAAALRVWRRSGRVVAVGLLDGEALLRLGIDPREQREEELARRIVEDVAADDARVLPTGEVGVECPPGALIHDLLGEVGWSLDEPWTLLGRDLAEPVEAPALHVDVVDADRAAAWAAVHRAAFDGTAVTQEWATRRFLTMAEGPAAQDARFLLGVDDQGRAVGCAGVWGAGAGHLGIVEPMGVDPQHRGRGYGREITLAAAGALRDLGAAQAWVATTTSNRGAVATYEAAGFVAHGQRRDRVRAAG